MNGPDQSAILCVDDDDNQLLAYEALLAPLSSSVTTAVTPEEALALTEQRSFDLLVLDVMMPGMNGFELASTIRRSRPKQAGAPILFVSALDRHLNLDAATKAGGDDFLTKPVTGKLLRAKASLLLSLGGIEDPVERAQAYEKLLLRAEIDPDTDDTGRHSAS